MQVRPQTQPLSTLTESKMKDLIDQILSENYVAAQNSFESRIHDIMEAKLHEMKKDMQAEVFGGLSKDEIEARKKAGYRKAADVLGDPDETRRKSLSPAKQRMMGAEAEKKKKKIAEDWGRAVQMGAKRTMTRLNVMRHVPGAVAGEIGRAASDAAKKVVSDPLAAAGKAGKFVAKRTGSAVAGGTKGLLSGIQKELSEENN